MNNTLTLGRIFTLAFNGHDLTYLLASDPRTAIYDGDGDGSGGDGSGGDGSGGDGSGGDGSGGDGSGGDGSGGDGSGDVLTNEQVNALLAKQKRKSQEELTKYRKSLEETEKTLEALQASSVTSGERDEEIEKLRNDLKTQLLTKEQQAEQEKKRLQDKHQNELEKVTAELKALQAQTLEQKIQGELMKACAKQSFNPVQTAHLLREHAEIVDDQVMMRFTAKDDHGKDMEPGLFTPAELVKELQELKYKDQWGNQFKTNIVQGVGGGMANTPDYRPQGPVDYKNMDQAEYKRRHAEGSLPHQQTKR